MNAKLISTIVAGLTFGVGPAANATDWADFSQSNTEVKLASASILDTTVLQTVTAVCPLNGFLIAQADAQFVLVQGSRPGHSVVGFSLTLDSTAPIAADIDHYRNLVSYHPEGFHYMPGGIQRVVRCTAGQSVTINFVAHRADAGTSTSALRPTLSVDFFDKRI